MFRLHPPFQSHVTSELKFPRLAFLVWLFYTPFHFFISRRLTKNPHRLAVYSQAILNECGFLNLVRGQLFANRDSGTNWNVVISDTSYYGNSC